MEENRNIMEIINNNSDSIEISKNAKGNYQWSCKCYGNDFNLILLKLKGIITEIEKVYKSE